MSGGSYDYLYLKIEGAARQLMSLNQPIYRQAFGRLLLAVSEAMHDVEWVDSGDYGKGDDEPKIMACMRNRRDELIYTAISNGQDALDRLQEELDKAKRYRHGED